MNIPERAKFTGSLSFWCADCGSEVYIDLDLETPESIERILDEEKASNGLCRECQEKADREAHEVNEGDARRLEEACRE